MESKFKIGYVVEVSFNRAKDFASVTRNESNAERFDKLTEKANQNFNLEEKRLLIVQRANGLWVAFVDGCGGLCLSEVAYK
jgi:hypothetical protein